MPTPLNRAKQVQEKPFTIKAKAGDTSAQILIYDQIGLDWWTGNGITATSFSKALDELPTSVKNVDLRVNSPGGDVFEGMTIFNRIKQKKGVKFTAYVDGLAASIASVIVLAADTVVMGEGAMYMIHKPWSITMGTNLEFDKMSQRLLDIEDQMLSIYKNNSDLSRDEIRQMVEEETWINSENAVKYGFADSIAGDAMPIAASAMSMMWMKNSPKDYKSLTSVTHAKAHELKNKIDALLARTK